MSYENVPKTDDETAVVVSQQRPDVFAFGVQGTVGTLASSTLATAAVSGDRDITLVSAVGFIAGNTLDNPSNTLNSKLVHIVAVVGNTLTLDRPLDGSYAAGTTVTTSSIAMNVAGSAANPIIFTLQPPAGQVWNLTRAMIAMEHVTAADMGLFGDLTALMYGVLARTTISGVRSTFINWKSNADMALTMYDVTFYEESKKGTFGTAGRFTFTKSGTDVRLVGDDGDKMEFIIQDDLSGLLSLRVTVQGSY